MAPLPGPIVEAGAPASDAGVLPDADVPLDAAGGSDVIAPAPDRTKTFTDPAGDAPGLGLDIGVTTVKVDVAGLLTIHVDMPNAKRSTTKSTDNFQIDLDTDRDRVTGTNGYDARIVLHGDGSSPFYVEVWDWEGTQWVTRTPPSFAAQFDNGVTLSVLASELGIPATSTFDFAMVSIDGSNGNVSDLAPPGALADRWTYTP